MTREEAIKEIKSWDFLEGKELEAIGTLIPELKESAEDERIYKEIMEFFKMNEKMCVINNHYPKWIAWLEKQKENLEKQKEQKPVEWDEDTKMNLDRALQIIKKAKGTLRGYQSDDGIYECDKAIECLEHFLYSGLEIEKTVEWSEEDEKIRQSIIKDIEFERNYLATRGTVIGKFDEQINWLKTISANLKKKNEDVAKLCSNEWSKEDEANLDYLIDYCNSQENGQHPILMTSIARKISLWLYRLKSGEITVKRQANEGWSNDDEERFDSVCSVLRSKLDEGNWKPLIDLLLRLKTAYCYQRACNEKDEKTIHLACEFIRHHATKIDSIGGIDCSELVERLKSIRPQPQSEWSEEDRRTIDRACVALRAYANGELPDILPSEILGYADKLQSLRPSWKPSEEQMRYLKKVYESYDFCDGERNALESLYEQLEKLM